MKYDKAIKIIRSAYGLSQKELAEETGLSQSVISRVESCEREPTEDFIETLLKKLNIPKKLFLLLSKNEEDVKSLPYRERQKLATTLLELIASAS